MRTECYVRKVQSFPAAGRTDLGFGVQVPNKLKATVEVTYAGEFAPWAVATCTMVKFADRLIVDELTIKRPFEDSSNLTRGALGDIPVEAMVPMAVFAAAQRGREPWIDAFIEERRRAIASTGPTPESLEFVAFLYRLAYFCILPPTKYVMDELGLTRPTAERWVSKAREAGLLGPATQGKAGGVHGQR